MIRHAILAREARHPILGERINREGYTSFPKRYNSLSRLIENGKVRNQVQGAEIPGA
jgi:hypothetical protein